MAESNVVVMETSLGTIKLELYPDKAPVTAENFLGYVDEGFYDGTVFHRIIPNFMIQGGGMEPGMRQKRTKAAIKNEAGNGLSNKRGTIAMARTNDPDSATAQFFINVKDNDFLDKNDRSAGYAVFGKVIDGMDVVDKIKAVKTGEKKFTVPDPRDPTKTVETTGDKGRPHANAPLTDVVIKSVRVEKSK